MMVAIPAGQTCPTVQRTNEENCVDECSSDDDCQYDRICCSNGCGGRTCSDSLETCAVRSNVASYTYVWTSVSRCSNYIVTAIATVLG